MVPCVTFAFHSAYSFEFIFRGRNTRRRGYAARIAKAKEKGASADVVMRATAARRRGGAL